MEFLVVVDMQNDFITGELGTPEALGILPFVAQKLVEFKGEVIFTHDSHFTDYLETREGRKLPIMHCIYETHGWQIHNCLPMKPEYKKLDKNGFTCNELPAFIDEMAGGDTIDKITLIGLCTDVCVVSNAIMLRSAFPEVDICVDSKCCAGTTPANHQAALDTMVSCQVDVF